MRLITILIAGGMLFTAAGQSTSTDSTKKSEKKQKTKPTPELHTIPPDATPLPDGRYRYTDKDGKKWIYRNTPFGVSKTEERPAPKVVQSIEDDPVKSEDLGDSLRFSRPTPFGTKEWTKKKTDLDDYEKSIWDRDRAKSSGSGEARQDGSKANQSGEAKPGDTGKQDRGR